MQKLTASQLDQIYQDSEQVDNEIFAEMRSNVLLVAGEHYTKKGSSFYNRIRDAENISKEVKLKLTKNHIKTIINDYEGKVLAGAQSTTVNPNNESEEQDIKAAELNKSVWEFGKRQFKFRSKVREWVSNYFQLGECYCKVFWDPNAGDVKGYAQLEDEDGNPLFDQQGQPVADKDAPIMTGDFVLESYLGFNVLRAPDVQNIDDSPYLILRKMINPGVLKKLINDDELYNKIVAEEEKTYLVFNSDNASYSKENNQIMFREHYYRPSIEYPNGYYYFAVRDYIVFEGELPFGIWPIAYAGCDKIATSARFRSPIKQMRPYQIEINRTASEIATTQITLGSDKVLMRYGSKITPSGQLPGIRAFTVTGGEAPTILSGRGGEQYIPWLDKNINELYQVMNVQDDDPTRNGQLDPYALLFRGMKNRQKFSKYGEAIEEFLVTITEIFLALAKNYYDDDMVIPMIGRSEMVNISEFKNTDKNKYIIKVDAVSVDTETMLGKQLAINHALQYVGTNLDKNEIGKFIRMMPFMNGEEAFSDLTLDYDTARNIILALDRGAIPIVNKYDNHEYIIKKLTDRMRKPDFNFLNPQIRNNYALVLNQYEQMEVAKQQAILRAEQGYIPTGGYLVICDFYTTNEEGKTQRVKLPYESIAWLIKQLEAQGQGLKDLESLNKGALMEMANMMGMQDNQGPASPDLNSSMGPASPIPWSANGY